MIRALGRKRASLGKGLVMLRILVVDDDTAVRGAIKMVLEQDGHEVTLAANGRAGVAAVEAGTFDLVICDIFMPGMDGIETIHAFHRHNPRMPVIAMSGFMFRDGQTPAPDYLSLSTKLGAAYSLRKPFRPHELLKAVRQCMANVAADPNVKATG
jgi:CheY-like chemotaxis protein